MDFKTGILMLVVGLLFGTMAYADTFVTASTEKWNGVSCFHANYDENNAYINTLCTTEGNEGKGSAFAQNNGHSQYRHNDGMCCQNGKYFIAKSYAYGSSSSGVYAYVGCV